MAFDKPTRNLLAKIVAACRDRLAADITDQLQSLYGLYPDGAMLDVARTEDDRRAAEDLRALLAHFEVAEAGDAAIRRTSAYQRLVREIGFTLLNRLAALRLGEERGLVIECVRRGMASDGFQLYDRIAGGALGNRYQTYRVFLECLFDELALDLGALFDRSLPPSAVFPSEAALTDVLALLNDPELAARDVWRQDETIGWIYQDYNDPVERQAMRSASRAPRNSRELAVRNQFFTPRYVVEFLTDNTLGRLWYEMRGGDTRLAEQCRYLVKRNDVKRNDIEHEGAGREDDVSRLTFDASRPKKDPRDLKILDPACGSGHFLLYAFDLLTTIYEEAWADPDLPPFSETGTWLVRDYPELDDLRVAIPGLILRHNLHGIDIDPRAVQIAALALWLRAQRAYQALELPPAQRPRITRTNIVTAEPMPGDPALLDEFVRDLRPRVLGDLVRVVFDRMTLAGEAGSLLKIEEELQEAIAQARRAWAAESRPEQLALFPDLQRPKAEQLLLFDVSGITDAAFWETAEERVLEALRRYAARAENGQGARRRLFADDAEQGFAFIDLCRQRYDVVLMNPPFGEPAHSTRELIKSEYRTGSVNVLSAFVLRARELSPNGLTGAITDSTWLKKADYGDLRSLLTNANDLPSVIADLGWGVLDDADVATCAFITARSPSNRDMIAFRLVDLEIDYKADHLGYSISKLHDVESARSTDNLIYVRPWTFFARFPENALAYETPDLLVAAFDTWATLDPTYAVGRRGYTPGDTFRFFRCWWEIPIYERGQSWWTLNNGSPYAPILGRGFFVSLYSNNWRSYESIGGFRLESEQWFGKPGLGYGKRTDFMYAYPLPAGAMFSNEGHCIFPVDAEDYWPVLGYLNSVVCQVLLNLYCGQHKTAGYVSKVPTPDLRLPIMKELGQHAKEIWFHSQQILARDETLENFVATLYRDKAEDLSTLARDVRDLELWYRAKLRQIDTCALSALTEYAKNEEDHQRILAINRPSPSLLRSVTLADNLLQTTAHPGDLVQFCAGIVFGRWDVRFALDSTLAPKPQNPCAPLPVCPPGMLVGPDGLPATTGRIVSEEWLRARPNAITLPDPAALPAARATIPDDAYPIRIAWDGILVDDPGLDGNNPHPSDIVRRVREVLAVLWPDRHESIEAEACEILGVRDLREYFRKPAGFFADHLKRYSKSRRQAPIYWPLSTASGDYTLWLYYHRLDDQILYTAVNRYVTPKIAQVEGHAARLEADLGRATGRAASDLRDRLDAARAFLGELREFREELLRVAGLPYKPNLNDGVIINAAPLHRLFRLRKWSQDTEAVWKKLAAGEYDWAHLAYTLWPDRVRDVCKRDRSIAIAHGLEALCEAPEKPAARKRGRKKPASEAGEMLALELE